MDIFSLKFWSPRNVKESWKLQNMMEGLSEAEKLEIMIIHMYTDMGQNPEGVDQLKITFLERIRDEFTPGYLDRLERLISDPTYRDQRVDDYMQMRERLPTTSML